MKKSRQKPRELNLQEIQGALFGLMCEFDRICKEHDIHYSLAYGTLLGAVRHKGFIPWDDDVDFVMTRPDYEKLYRLVHDGTIDLGERYVLSEDRGKHAFYSFLKLMDKNYAIKRFSQKEVPYLFVDIFPLDGAPKDGKALKKLRRKRFKYSALMALARWAVPEHKWMLVFRALFFPFYLGATLYGMARAARKATAAASETKFEESENCSLFSFYFDYWLMPCQAFTELTELTFEGRSFLALTAWDEWLTKLYGDYMTPPPEGKRWKHNLKVFCNSEDK